MKILGKKKEQVPSVVTLTFTHVFLETFTTNAGGRHMRVNGHGVEMTLFNIDPDFPADAVQDCDLVVTARRGKDGYRADALQEIFQDGTSLWKAKGA